jgi:hypothetical protein
VPPAQQALFDTGHAVGEIARQLYDPAGFGVFIDGSRGMAAALAATRKAVKAAPNAALFEATVERDGLLVRADVITREGGAMRLVEVKSSTSVKPEHVTDVAIQSWVLEGSPLAPESVALAHINNGFVYPGGGDYVGLLVEQDLTESMAPVKSRVPGWLAAARLTLEGPEPDAAIGTRCKQPYECPFRGYCWPKSEYPLTGLPGINSRLDEALAAGYADVRDLPEEFLKGRDARRVWEAVRGGVPVVESAALAPLRELTYPRYYLDFETVGPAIPRWPGTRPFQSLVFQWSLHVERAGRELAHAEFLDLSGELPVRAAAEALLAAIGTEGPVVTYTGYEKTCLNQMAALCPDLAMGLQAVVQRLVDIHPTVKAGYYHPAMQGSWSIKKVVPTVAPELDYGQLEGIQEGQAAQLAYQEAIDPELPAARREEIRRQLLDYCARDTLAMVRLVQALS